eukprot:scaffold152915_cov30-Prasinocladus_malaysianus.AAC.1
MLSRRLVSSPQRRRAPPPLSVTTESTEPTGSDIVMLSEDQAQRLAADVSRENLRASFWTVDDGLLRPSSSRPNSMFRDAEESEDDRVAEMLAAGESSSAVEPFQAEQDAPVDRPLPGATDVAPAGKHEGDLGIDDVLEL